MQSSGSTLLSWCFLQRPDMNGTLDGDTDLIPLLPVVPNAPYLWYKTTISSFTLAEQMAVLEDEGREVMPLLMVRDVRAVWMSLMKKPYGRNGVTAEDPPLRLRFRRFLNSWVFAREQGIPIFRYEDLAGDAEASLRGLCEDLGLSWDPAMLNWPKPAADIADARHGNARFMNADKAGLEAVFDPRLALRISGRIHEEDLVWLEETFAAFNQDMGYEQHHDGLELLPGRLLPSWEASRRLNWRLRQKPLRYLAVKLGLSRYRPRPQ
ncbi:hypothetical protein [Thiolapillus brandeum]|nr:hypothetical protein [Thiolapillus brandeum]